MASGNDIQAATKTYEGFVSMIKWSAPIMFVLTFFVIYLIS